MLQQQVSRLCLGFSRLAHAAAVSTITKKIPPEYHEDSQVVYTTGICNSKNGAYEGRIGVFWQSNDSSNLYKPIEKSVDTKTMSAPFAELEAVLTALRSAIHEKQLASVMIKTDSEFVVKCAENYIKNWRNNGFMKRDGTVVKHKTYFEELDRLMAQINAQFVFEQTKTRFNNRVIDMLQTDERLQEIIENDAEAVSPELTSIAAPTHENVVYTAGAATHSGKFTLTGYGIHWPSKPMFNKCGRFSQIPCTLFRAQLQSIITALEAAKENQIESIHIATDCDRFLRFRVNDWKKKDGTSVANVYFYKQIVQLEKSIKVEYSFVSSEKCNNMYMEQALMLAEDGLAYPTDKQLDTVEEKMGEQ